MAKADRVYITPPINTPVDTTRRRFIAVAAFASVAGADSIAAAAMAPKGVPQALTLPNGSGFQADPIYEVIERHRKAAREHTEAINTHMAFEKSNMQGEKLGQYKRLVAPTEAAYDELDDAGCDLINTKATTLPGLLALCQSSSCFLRRTRRQTCRNIVRTTTARQRTRPKHLLIRSAARSRK
jgi:hypothetical protein